MCLSEEKLSEVLMKTKNVAILLKLSYLVNVKYYYAELVASG